MRTSAQCGVAAVLAATVSVCGCARSLPPGPTAVEIAEYIEDVQDSTWRSSPFAVTGGPQLAVSGDAPAGDIWFAILTSCIDYPGYGATVISYSEADGYGVGRVMGESGEAVEEQLALYRCVATNPTTLTSEFRLYSEAQLDYIYDYYRTWLVPCLGDAGQALEWVPTWQQFAEQRGQWTPYWSTGVPVDSAQYNDLIAACGPERPPLE